MKITCMGMACTPLKKKPYRVLAISEMTSLYDLAEEIIKSFCFEFDHCFGFYDNLKHHTESSEVYELFIDLQEEGELDKEDSLFMNCNVPLGVKKTAIKNVFAIQGKKMLFKFDYGDDWHFEVERLGSIERKPRKKYPYIMERRGLSPRQYPQWD